MNLCRMAGCSDKPGNERTRRRANDKFCWSVVDLRALPSSPAMPGLLIWPPLRTAPSKSLLGVVFKLGSGGLGGWIRVADWIVHECNFQRISFTFKSTRHTVKSLVLCKIQSSIESENVSLGCSDVPTNASPKGETTRPAGQPGVAPPSYGFFVLYLPKRRDEIKYQFHSQEVANRGRIKPLSRESLW